MLLGVVGSIASRMVHIMVQRSECSRNVTSAPGPAFLLNGRCIESLLSLQEFASKSIAMIIEIAFETRNFALAIELPENRTAPCGRPPCWQGAQTSIVTVWL